VDDRLLAASRVAFELPQRFGAPLRASQLDLGRHTLLP
jgi:hypothetical protein